MVQIKVKWGKQVLDVDCDTTLSVDIFKAQLQSLTGVPADRMKVMGVKGGQLKDDADLSTVGIAAGKTLMLLGSAEALPEGPAKPVVFAEDVGASLSQGVILPVGLKNLANTCYMNSVLQTLRMVPEFTETVKSLPDQAPALPRSLGALYKTLEGAKDPAAPMAFWTSLITEFPQFGQTDDRGFPMQQDSQEALVSILSSVQKAFAGGAMGESTKDPIRQLFEGERSEALSTVGDESTATTSIAPFTVLPCHINEEVQTLEAGLQNGLTETFTAGEGASEVTKVRKMALSKLPEYMFVYFVRFHWRGDTKKKAKVLKPITFPMILDTYTLCSDELKESLKPERDLIKQKRDALVEISRAVKGRSSDAETVVKAVENEMDAKRRRAENGAPVPGNTSGYYELCSVISHKGRDADGGHYVAWGKKGTKWLIFDDENVAEMKEEDVKRLRGVGEAHIAYVLLYRSRDPDTHQPPVPM